MNTILCLMGALFGFMVLFKDLHITRSNVATEVKTALPVIIGTLAWLSSAYTFQIVGEVSPITHERFLLLVSWCWLVTQYKDRYKPT